MQESPPTLCPQCWDSMLQPVQGVELVALHVSAITVVSGISVYHCSNWHFFAVFSADISDPSQLS